MVVVGRAEMEALVGMAAAPVPTEVSVSPAAVATVCRAATVEAPVLVAREDKLSP